MRENWDGQTFPIVGNLIASSMVAIDEVEFYGNLAALATPAITLQSPVFVGGHLTFGITSVAGISVDLERAIFLSGAWTNIGTALIGDNGFALFQDTNAPPSAGFYRARQR
jgi:hypothetical protein